VAYSLETSSNELISSIGLYQLGFNFTGDKNNTSLKDNEIG
jgi:hypothetical protein